VSFIPGVNLLPGTGEFTYATIARRGQRAGEAAPSIVNAYASGDPSLDTDFEVALDQLQAAYPACTTVSLIVSWFFDGVEASACRVYPSTTYIGGTFERRNGASWGPDLWRVSGLTQWTSGLIPISSNGGTFTYGGTPSDQAVYEAIADLKARGLRVVFYPFLLGDVPGSFPWRGRITHAPDMTTAAENAVAAFLGNAALGDFVRDTTNKTVTFRGGANLDWGFRRMILHYANLCVIAGGVDLFVIGSELRGLETIRGIGWTKPGVTGGDGRVTWDYPFVDAMKALADDVRSVFDSAGLAKNTVTKKNLVTYAADWSDWMGFQHPGEGGQWPHLDQLYGHANIDLVAIDNYMPLSDWTTGDGGLDALYWSEPKYSGEWPPDATQMNGLGLAGTPRLASKDYLKANIEGGEKFFWFYADGANLGQGQDPIGSGERVSRPAGDRAAQTRSRYYPDQEILANKQLRWWWTQYHSAVYDTGGGWAPQGGPTRWTPESKSICFTEYGFPSLDKATNQPNVFYDPKSSESFTPYWSVWASAYGGGFLPSKDWAIAVLALQAIYEYWFVDGHNIAGVGGNPMLDAIFCSVWALDARPFPTFPLRSDVWGDAGNWAYGHWFFGKTDYRAPPPPDIPPSPGSYPRFPKLPWPPNQ